MKKRRFIQVAVLFLIIFIPIITIGSSTGSDDYLKKMVIGTWILEDSISYGEAKVQQDGTCLGRGYVIINNQRTDYNFKSTWKISNGFWIETITESTLPETIGIVSNDKIIKIDSEEFVFVTDSGEKATLRRKK